MPHPLAGGAGLGKGAGGRAGCRIRRFCVCGFRVNFIPNLLHFSPHSRQSDEIIGRFAGVP